MNRARPITVALHALLSVLLLLLAAQAVVAQNRSRDPHGQMAKLFGTRPGPRAATQHPFYGVIPRLPAGMTRRILPKNWNRNTHGVKDPITRGINTRAPGDGGVTRQTVLLTRMDPNSQNNTSPTPSQDEHPFWTKDEKNIFWDSNRNSATDPSAGPNFNIYSMFYDGSGIAQVTTGSDNKLDPNVTQDGGRLAYVAGGSINLNLTNLDSPPTTGFNLYVLDLINGGAPLPLTSNQSQFVFSDVRHPSWSPGGTLLAFAGELGANTPYHIFVVDSQSGAITQMTAGPSNDYSPAWSPDPNGNVIAFTTNANGWTTNAAPIVSSGVTSNDDIWAITGNKFQANPVKVTGFSVNGQASSNKNPAWSSLNADPLQIVPGNQNNNGQTTSSVQLLAFASTRADTDPNNPGVPNAIKTTFDIYWLTAKVAPDPNHPGFFTVTTPETAGNPGIKLRTSTPDTAIDPSDPSSAFDPNFQSNEDFPAWPQYINSYRVAFQSDRGGNLNLWASTMFDIDAPTLLKYDIPNNEIVHVARNATPDLGQRQFSAGDTVRFRVRAVDYESGIESVYVQIKCPNSAPQSADGTEHKVFFVGPGQLDTTVFTITPGTPSNVIGAAYELDAQAINPYDYSFHANGYVPPGYQEQGVSIPTNWPGWNQYIAGIDDELAFSGYLNPPDDPVTGLGFWLQLYDDGPISKGGHEPEGEVAGDGVYTNTWITPPNFPSDFILDVIVRDRAVDPFDPVVRTNWKIYDNVWGFTTQPFQAKGQILYVNDYDCGQRFFQTHFGVQTTPNLLAYGLFNGIPTESWMTEIDPKLLPTGWITPPTTTGPLSNVLMPLGANSYLDGLTNPNYGAYDQWRILCRGPVPTSVLTTYGPHIETQPPDILSGGTAARQVEVAERCVLWHAPYTGDLFIGPGTLLDNQTQANLAAFVAGGGRLFVDGEDIAWALTLGGSTQSAFLSQVLHASYAGDDAHNGVIAHVNLVNTRGPHPISTDPWYPPIYHTGYLGPGTPPYDPPAGTPLYIINPFPLYGPGRDYASPNQETPDVVRFLISPTVADNADIDGAYSTFTAAPNAAIMWDRDTSKLPIISKVVFSPFGWEGANPESFTVAGGLRLLRNRRAELIHGVVCWLRTGRIVGRVLGNQGGGAGLPLNKVFVRATGSVPVVKGIPPPTVATALTATDGTFVLDGIDPTGLYTIDASKAGFLAEHLVSTAFHGGDQGKVDLFLQQAPPGSISGKVTQVGSGAPVAGAIVQAVDITGTADNSQPYTATTQADGTYTINNVLPSTYAVTVTNYTALGYAGSVPPSYGGGQPGAQPAVTVGASQNVSGINFQLKAAPGTIVGQVTRQGTNIAIAGALVTATNGTTTFTATTDANGNYSISADPGTYGVVATAPGYQASTSVSVNVVTKGQITLNIALTPIPPGSISGLVATSFGVPVSGATIILTDAAGNPLHDLNGNVITGTSGAAQTVNGYTFNYKITNVPAGTTVNVSARKDGYSPDPTQTQAVNITSNTETTGINFTLDPLHTFSPALSLVSAPYEYSTDLVTLLGIPAVDVTNGNFLFATWNGSDYVYYPNPPASDTFHLGVGYFLQDTDPNATLALTTKGIAADSTKEFDIKLKTGWNMIGDPFTFSLNFQGLKIIDTTGAVEDIITAQSGSNPAIGGALWTFQSGNYQVVFTVDPWRGYWLRAFRDVTLVVDPSAQIGRSPRAAQTGPLPGNTTGDGWKLELHAQAGTVPSAPGILGVAREATNSYDRYKLEAPPAFGKKLVTLTFDHKDWAAKSGRYSMDIRNLTAGTQGWDFTVTSNVTNTPVTLTWPAIATLPGRQDVMLTDVEAKTTVNLKNRSVYTLPASNGPITHHFHLEVHRAARQMLQVLNLSARINATRGVGVSASIGYTITADATVQVNILQNGHRIRTIESGHDRAAGAVEATWDLKNDQGIAVSSNTYTVEVRAVDKDGHLDRKVTPLLISR